MKAQRVRSIASLLSTETKPSVVNRPVRISFVITDLDVGGAERALVALATGLNRTRWTPSVICLDKPGALVASLEQADIPTLCLGVDRRKPLQAIARLAKALREQHPEIVQSFLFHANLATRLAAPFAGRPRVVSGLRVAEHQRRWHLTLDRITQSLASGSVCVSHGVLRHSLNPGGISPDRLVVIPNGVDPRPFDQTNPFSFAEWLETHAPIPMTPLRQTNPFPATRFDRSSSAFDETNPFSSAKPLESERLLAQPQPARQTNPTDFGGDGNSAAESERDLHQRNPFSSSAPENSGPSTTSRAVLDDPGGPTSGSPNEPIFALFVGRLDRQKGVDVLLKALGPVVSHPRPWHLFVVGDGPERELLQSSLRSEPALNARVHWLGRRTDVPALLKGADLLILPSRWEGMPNVVLEAMASGRAVIGTKVEGTEDLVEPEVTGWLVPPDDPVALTSAIEEALDDPTRLKQMGLAARERVEARFSPESVVQAYERLWAGLLQIRFENQTPLTAAGVD